jgi:hypothetical protein
VQRDRVAILVSQDRSGNIFLPSPGHQASSDKRQRGNLHSQLTLFAAWGRGEGHVDVHCMCIRNAHSVLQAKQFEQAKANIVRE